LAELDCLESELAACTNFVVKIQLGENSQTSEVAVQRDGTALHWENQSLGFNVSGDENAKIYVYDLKKRKDDKSAGWFGEGVVKLWNLYSHVNGNVVLNLYRDGEHFGKLRLKYQFTQDFNYGNSK
jgi:hypothetical protein